MTTYRIDIKKESEQLPFGYSLLKWVIALYVVVAACFLLYKFYSLLFRNIAFSEWMAVGINLVLVSILTRQLLRLNETRFLIVNGTHVKFRQRFPWCCTIAWSRIKRIQFGYSSVRFITHNGKRYRFSLTKITEDEQAKLFSVLEQAAGPHNVQVLKPM